MRHSVQRGSRKWMRTWTGAAAILIAGAFTIPAMAQTAISAQQADQITQNAVSGSTLIHTSADHMGNTPVWDIHVARGTQVWDIKVDTQSGAILLKRLSSEHHPTSRVTGSTELPSAREHQQSHDAQDNKQPQNGAGFTPLSGTMVFNQKLTVVPAVYQSYVTHALNSVGGTLKWVKFSRQAGGNIQMNIKIRKLGGGTTKVKDTFNHAGQLVLKNTSADN